MPANPFYTTSFKGIGNLTVREIHSHLKVDRDQMTTGSVRDYDITQFVCDRTDELGALRTTEDVFYDLGAVVLTGHRSDEGLVSGVIDAAEIEKAITCKRALTPKARPGRPTYRVIVQADDASWRTYRRERLEESVARALSGRYRKWRRVEDDSQIEVWVHLLDRTALIGLRLTDRTMRHRDYKVTNLPGSLRPTIAAAAVQLSKPTDSDVFLDPACGAGTILIERALSGPHQMLHGGDISDEAVAATLQNFANRHRPWDIRTWDATSLPLQDGAITRVVTNPPWGRQISAGQNLAGFYKQALQEIERVLAPWGRAVVLTSEWKAMQGGLKVSRSLRIDEQIKDISVLGRRADLFCLIRTAT